MVFEYMYIYVKYVILIKFLHEMKIISLIIVCVLVCVLCFCCYYTLYVLTSIFKTRSLGHVLNKMSSGSLSLIKKNRQTNETVYMQYTHIYPSALRLHLRVNNIQRYFVFKLNIESFAYRIPQRIYDMFWIHTIENSAKNIRFRSASTLYYRIIVIWTWAFLFVFRWNHQYGQKAST